MSEDVRFKIKPAKCSKLERIIFLLNFHYKIWQHQIITQWTAKYPALYSTIRIRTYPTSIVFQIAEPVSPR